MMRLLVVISLSRVTLKRIRVLAFRGTVVHDIHIPDGVEALGWALTPSTRITKLT